MLVLEMQGEAACETLQNQLRALDFAAAGTQSFADCLSILITQDLSVGGLRSVAISSSTTSISGVVLDYTLTPNLAAMM